MSELVKYSAGVCAPSEVDDGLSFMKDIFCLMGNTFFVYVGWFFLNASWFEGCLPSGVWYISLNDAQFPKFMVIAYGHARHVSGVGNSGSNHVAVLLRNEICITANTRFILSREFASLLCLLSFGNLPQLVAYTCLNPSPSTFMSLAFFPSVLEPLPPRAVILAFLSLLDVEIVGMG